MAAGDGPVVTIDTNVAVYAFEPGAKTDVAAAVLRQAELASNQVANEYANVMRRKFNRSWREIDRDIDLLHEAIPSWHPVERSHTREALRLADRYQLQFYDALLIAVGLAHGVTTLFSEDMQHGLVIEGRLRIENPFL